MNPAHLHLLVNHFPLIGFVFSILLLSIGLLRLNKDFVNAALLIILISGILSIITYLTGEPAEEVIKKLPNFSENLVEAHEEAAELAIWFIGATTLLSGASIWLAIKRIFPPKGLLIAILALNLITLISIGRTNNLGGRISHPEIRNTNDTLPVPVENL